jgi:hypothetical protein
MEETPISWTWTPIKLDEELAGERVPAPDELRFDERWLAPETGLHVQVKR